jgi:hypothetical protein
MRFLLALPVLLSTLSAPASAPVADKPLDPRAVEFFEQKIRPVLVEHCLKCHSVEADHAKKLKASLYLDSRDGLRKGGESGPAIVPHKPSESLLLKAMKYDGDVKMPPKGKLPAAVLADFEKWINMGAPDPRNAALVSRKQVGMTIEEGRSFWAYKLPLASAVPHVRDTAWPNSTLDRFILAKLEAKGKTPAREADRPILARRLYYDLTGLPPTLEEVDAFVRDSSPDAYERLVDRLLGSLAFGERWGRHWLDIARFGESVTLRGMIFKEAWRYRDYVIDTFNCDVPFDQFVREQIAGDLLPAKDWHTRRRQLIATTFLALGNTNLEEQDKKQLRMDVVDEQLDVIAKGFLAQTITCARCHDHKFDPIPTRDYYALASILRNVKAMEHANVSAWLEMPLPADPAREEVLRKHESQLATLQAKLKVERAKAGKTKLGALAIKDVPGLVVDDVLAKKVGEWKSSQATGTYIGDGYLHDENGGKGDKTLTFQPDLVPPGKYEVRLSYSHGTSRSNAVPVTVFSAGGEKTVHVDMKKAPPVEGRYVSLGEYHFEKNGLAYVLLSNEGTKGHVTADAVVFVPLDRAVTKRETKATDGADTLRTLEAEFKRLQATGPKREMVMTVIEEKAIEETRVHVRGNVHNLGEPAPRGFLRVAMHSPMPTMAKDQSGRRELAEWIASDKNPLTARVIVNRTWHWLFGSGIVRTTDNFGTTGERPSHPELLDHLAIEFIHDGWSMKRLIRRIVLSRTYRQSSEITDNSDPENTLFGRANRRRLEAESIRDTLLAISGELSREHGGPTYPVTLTSDYGYKGSDTRRSLYQPMFRNAMPELLEVFDAADPSTVTGRRNTSTIAPQALYLMNHAFPAEQAKHATARLVGSPDERITWIYRMTVGREPTSREREVVRQYVQERDEKEAWASVIHALFASAEFRYVR